MPFFSGSVAGGAAEGMQQSQQMNYLALIMQAMKAKQQQEQQQLLARKQLGGVLYGMDQGQGQIPQPPPMSATQPPQPGQPSVAPGGPGTPGPAGAQAGPAAGAMPISMPPYQTVPKPAPQTQTATSQIPSPPAAAAAPAVQEPKPFDLRMMIQTLKKQGVPEDQVMNMLDELAPVMNAQNKQELDVYKAHNKALEEASKIYLNTINATLAPMKEALAEKKQKADEDIKRQDLERKKQQGDERNRIAKQKLNKQTGGDNITKWETDDDGNVVGGYTKTGKHIALDDPSTAKTPGGKATEKGEAGRFKQIASWRQELATLQQNPSPSPQDKTRMEELKKKIRESDKGGATSVTGDIAGKLKASGKPYEPDKYDYRVNPDTGEIERKLKGG